MIPGVCYQNLHMDVVNSQLDSLNIGASEFSTNTIYTAVAHNYHMGSTPRHKLATLFLFIYFCRLMS